MTLRELVIAAQEKQYFELEKQAGLMALIANCHRDGKKRRRPFIPYDFFHRPGEKRPRGKSLTVDALHSLKPVFTKEA